VASASSGLDRSAQGASVITLGIDIGLTGAIAAIGSGHAAVHDLPTVPDGKGRRLCGRGLILLIRELVPADGVAVVLIEDVRPRPMGNAGAHGNTMHSQGSLMRSRGIVEAACDIARLGVTVVQPQTWKRFYGLIGKGKGDSADTARKLYPGCVDHLKRVKDHNRSEALLIAHYGQCRQA
jgi:hypothetical protein